MTGNQDVTAAEHVRDEVARADRIRRGRDAARGVARLAPAAAGVLCLVAVIGRLAGWSPLVAWAALAAFGLGLAAYVVVLRRSRDVSDRTAARVDADAHLAGELRSAHWFAGRPEPSGWVVFHLERAATTLRDVKWERLYPPVPAGWAWTASALLVVTSVAVTLRPIAPGTGAVGRSASAAAGTLAGEVLLLPPDVSRRLEALLAAAQRGTLSASDARQLADLRDALAKIDPNLDSRLAELAKRVQDAANKASLDKSPRDPADANARPGDPNDLKNALDELAARLADTRTGDRASGSDAPASAAGAGQFSRASAQAAVSPANAAQAAIQSVREAATDPGRGQQMMGGGAMGGDSRAGAGGNAGARSGAAADALRAEALRRELIEAHADAPGTNVLKEDIRRKTEQGKSQLGFTRVAAPATFDRSRTLAPPPVPEARRPLVQGYFIRR